MNPEKQQIAIAEACGWVNRLHPSQEEYAFLTVEEWIGARLRVVGRNLAVHPDGLHHQIPDYLNNLNAMREAAMTLSGEELMRYRQHLDHLCGNDMVAPIAAYDATAAHRAEAFLRALNLWTEQ